MRAPVPMTVSGMNPGAPEGVQMTDLTETSESIASSVDGSLSDDTAGVSYPRIIDANDAEANESIHGPFCDNVYITSRYTKANFLPKFMYETFSKVANVYFLLIGILQAIPAITTTGGVPLQLFPLFLVIAFDAVLVVYEDYKRHKADAKENSRVAWKLDEDSGDFMKTTWARLKVGDMIKVSNREPVPADIVILTTSSVDENGKSTGNCFVETKSLDGETNLKLREAMEPTVNAILKQSDLTNLKFRVMCEAPNPNIHNFSGAMNMGEGPGPGVSPTGAGAGRKTASSDASTVSSVSSHGSFSSSNEHGRVPITADNVALRGVTLRSTDWVYGFIVNTGPECKIAQSAPKSGKLKMSNIMVGMNSQLKLVVLIMVSLCAVGVIIDVVDFYKQTRGQVKWYMGTDADKDTQTVIKDAVVTFFYYFSLLSSFIPITLYVSIDVVKLCQSKFMQWDSRMYHEATDTQALVRNMKLTEQLGAIKYIFSDKTGTLTENIMEFRKCSIGGVSYGTGTTEIGRAAKRRAAAADPDAADVEVEIKSDIQLDMIPNVNFNDDALWHALERGSDQHRLTQAFFRHLALCHTVVPEPTETGEIILSASSPDEQALVAGAQFFGYEFTERTQASVKIRTGNSARYQAEGRAKPRDESFEVLEILEFNSTRKRMSVILKDRPSGDILLLCKGADNVISARVAKTPANQRMLEQTALHCGQYAEEGLRTLYIAQKRVSPAVFDNWQKRYVEALGDASEVAKRAALEDNRIDDLMDEMEHGLELLGATAIEDKLQDGVPSAISKLAEAGINIWVLTGDKEATAINIGFACELLHNDMDLIIANDELCKNEAEVLQMLDDKVAEVEEQDEEVAGDALHETGVRKDEVHQGFNRLSDLTGLLPGSARPQAPPSSPLRRKGSRTSNLGLLGARATADDINSNARLSALGDPGHIKADSLMGHTIKATAVARERALVIDGPVLIHALASQRGREALLRIGTRCKAVVACRVSPKQKAEVVQLVQDNVPDVTTLSIGDGANDVPMIKAATVGVGISGQEGMQAVNSSDFAIAQFCYLCPLLLVHGRWNYSRVAKLVLYTFYKNTIYNISMFLYAAYASGSGTMFYNIVYQLGFNTIYTSLPIVVYAVLDQDVAAESALAHPVLYDRYLQGEVFNIGKFWKWIIDATVEAFVVCYVPLYCMDMNNYAGQGLSMEQIGCTSWSAMILVVLLKLTIHMHQWTIYHKIVFWFSVLSWYGSATWFGLTDNSFNQGGFRGVIPVLFFMPTYWLLCVMIVVLALFKDVAWKGFMRMERPAFYHIVQEVEAYGAPSAKLQLQQLNPHKGSERTPSKIDAARLKRGSMQKTTEGKLQDDVKPWMRQRSESYQGFAFSEDARSAARRIETFQSKHRRKLARRMRAKIESMGERMRRVSFRHSHRGQQQHTLHTQDQF